MIKKEEKEKNLSPGVVSEAKYGILIALALTSTLPLRTQSIPAIKSKKTGNAKQNIFHETPPPSSDTVGPAIFPIAYCISYQ